MRKKKIWLICGVLFFVLLLLLFFCFRPRSLISLPYTISDSISTESDISISSIYFNGEDLTKQIDHAELLEMLSKYSCRLTLKPAGTYVASNAWEINLNQGGNPLHIVVNDSPFCYWTTSFKHNIIESETLYQELISLTGTSQ